MAHGGEVGQEGGQPITGSEVVKQRLNGHTRAGEDGCAVEDVVGGLNVQQEILDDRCGRIWSV